MHMRILSTMLLLWSIAATAQTPKTVTANNRPNTENIYTIRQKYLQQVLHNPTERNADGDDNGLERFNRWFHFVEPRCYPSGNMPRPDILITEFERITSARQAARTTGPAPIWRPLGPDSVPYNYFGIGRINCIVMNPQDTNTLYAGAPCGGVWISHNHGLAWTSTTDNFPSLSVADIAVNPNHPDTLYAATGDGYGNVFYGAGLDSIFWGGLYSAGIMKSTDGGNTWRTTGLSYLQTNRDIIHRIVILPNNPNVLLAATSSGVYRSTDAAATWTQVDTGYIYSMTLRPQRPDTIYTATAFNVRASYDGGITWTTLAANVNQTQQRCTIATSPASPHSIWLLTDLDSLMVSHNDGATFTAVGNPAYYANFYGYYDQVLAISPTDSTFILSAGLGIAASYDGGATWNSLDSSSYYVHPDNHAITFNPQNSSTIYFGNDGGIVSTPDAGNSWTNLGNGLTISQIYRMSSSRQNPYRMLCGLQDNATFYNDGIGDGWVLSNGPYGDGMDCAIYAGNDSEQIASTQDGNFWISYDQGATFSRLPSTGSFGYWTAPVVISPYSADTFYLGYTNLFASFDGGLTLTRLTNYGLGADAFQNGAVSIALSNSNRKVIYAADLQHIIRTSDGGSTWTDVTGSLTADSLPITRIAVDYHNPMVVYVTTSGYTAGMKVFVSTTGGTTWTSQSTGLPNLPANCIVTDSSIKGALYVGTDIGVYYTDSTMTSWMPYGTGLPNVVVQDLEINYTNRMLRAPTYGRGVWEIPLNKYPVSVPVIAGPQSSVHLSPNPSATSWNLVFGNKTPATYTVTVSDMAGHALTTQQNSTVIDASRLASGAYDIEVAAGSEHYTLKAIKE